MGDFRTSLANRSANQSATLPDDPAIGLPPVQPTGGARVEDAPEEQKTSALGATVRRSDVRVWSDQLSDDKAELEQDAGRLARNAFGAAQRPLPQQIPLNGPAFKKATEGVNATLAQAIGKRPNAGGALNNQSHQHRPPVKRRERTLFGGAPKQLVAHRPLGALDGAVTIS